MAGTEYHKIWSPFARYTSGPNRNKFDETTWARPEFRELANCSWWWSEKVDGTNVRIIWDGHKPRFGGRTDSAQMPKALLDVLTDMFTEELLEQQFKGNPAVLYGEGYGARIQKGGGNYRPDPGFVLFDVKIGPWWLLPHDVQDVADSMGVDIVPHVMVGNVNAAIAKVRAGLKSHWGDFEPEGLVGRPPLGLTARDGDRLLMKIKRKDFA